MSGSGPLFQLTSRLYATVVFQPNPFRYEFHINKYSRMKYRVQETLLESTGNVVLPNFRAVRELAYAINEVRGVLGKSDKEVRAGFLNAMGLLDEIGHFLVRLYDEHENPGVIGRAFRHAEEQLGTETVEKVLLQFIKEFPPKAVYRGLQSEKAYFESFTSQRAHKEIALEELVMLHLANINPANRTVKELFDDTNLIAKTRYMPLLSVLERFFEAEKPFGPDALPLLSALKRPILEHPDNIEAQLGFLKERYGIVLTTKFIDRIAAGAEFTKEEERFIWHAFHAPDGPPVVETFVPEYPSLHRLTEEERRALLRSGTVRPEDLVYAEPEQFTPDTDWMPNVVLIAKNTYVWLDQLSKKYSRPIKRLDQIPDEELDQLARWHFTSLWLIGVWERSVASKRIKQITGNLDAVSSAYSLFDYEIAADIGGEEAFQDLNRRCWQRGIRLAGDMVPNHMGLFSKWVLEHPEYFIQSEHAPYPNYRFTGENLSHDPNIELRIEDGYWSRSDAAVVFQRIDRRNGEVRYFYHGNDGTSMPWNDTAQLNLLRADVREAVIQSIFHVARKFSVIRFDAAMTLAKKHFQRLWYPMPGTSGVPSRQDHSLSRAEFDALFPNEFWREVVDRFNAEMPQTLLLAEAFWLMEGYFVRTLGMHRVYNSAFMHMLMKEENQKFRAMIKNTLEFNPEILKRYVNFMSNPDEQTAVEQFGKDDKYFGVATLMVTLPGLPMFAHGQVEGFREKYGMEYQRAYYNETADEWLVRRHEHEIFPLTKKRYLFSQVHNFEFYDFIDDRGFVNENVIAYSNKAGNERAIVFFHNTFAECSGYINHSLQKAVNERGDVRSVPLGNALQFNADDGVYYRFRDRSSNLEYLLSGKELSRNGIRLSLRAFQYAVLTDFVELRDENGLFRDIAQRLNGTGTHSLESLIQSARLRPFHQAIELTFIPFTISAAERDYPSLLASLSMVFSASGPGTSPGVPFSEVIERSGTYLRDQETLPAGTQLPLHLLHLALFKCITDCRSLMAASRPLTVAEMFRELNLTPVLVNVLTANGETPSDAERAAQLIEILVRLHERGMDHLSDPVGIVETVLEDFDSANYLGVNQYQDIWYYQKEKFTDVIAWFLAVRTLFSSPAQDITTEAELDRELLRQISGTSDASGYQVERLKELVGEMIVAEKKRRKKVTKTGNSSKGTGKKGSGTKKRTAARTRKKDVKKVTKRKSPR